MIGTKNNLPKSEGMYGTKITRQRDGWMGGELNGQHENNSPKDGESNK